MSHTPDIALVSISPAVPRTVPSGVLSIAATLEKAGYDVGFLDFTFRDYCDLDPSDLCAGLGQAGPVVGLSSMSDALPFAVVAALEIKQRWPGKTVILGGPGPTGVARALIETFPFIDIVVVGEGEDTILETMECLKGGRASTLESVAGICYRHNGDVGATAARPRIRNLDALRVPLYGKVSLAEYPLVNVVFSRGCPYQCTFCDVAPMWARKNFRRSVASAIAEIRFLAERCGRRNFEFTDETFVLSHDTVFELCKEMRRLDLAVTWSCTGRVNLMTEPLLREMAAAGCRGVFYGIESGSDEVLRRVKKEFSVRQAVDVIDMTLEHMGVVASFIWGFPFETEDDLAKTLLLTAYLSRLGVDTRLNRLAPLPLMPLYDEYRGRLVDFDGAGCVSEGEAFAASSYRGPARDLIQLHPDVFASFYWFPAEHLEEKAAMVSRLGRYGRSRSMEPVSGSTTSSAGA